MTDRRFLREVEFRPDPAHTNDLVGFPFDLALVQTLRLKLACPVTILVGENGTGKSTLLEAIAIAMRCVAIGSADLERDPTLLPAKQLAEHLRLTRDSHPRTAMFFRAEDAFGFVQRVRREADALQDLEREFEDSFEDGSLAQRLAVGSARSQRLALQERYGADPDARSHGESFLHLLDQRLAPQGFYVLDEPETPLSPLRVLALLDLLLRRVEQGCQFILATHSPLLMAFPGAQLLSCDGEALSPIDFDEVEHVTLTRSFLADPEAYLRRLGDR